MIDGTKCMSDWIIHRRGPSCDCDQTQYIASGESSIRSLTSVPQPAYVTIECDRLVKQCVDRRVDGTTSERTHEELMMLQFHVDLWSKLKSTW